MTIRIPVKIAPMNGVNIERYSTFASTLSGHSRGRPVCYHGGATSGMDVVGRLTANAHDMLRIADAHYHYGEAQNGPGPP